MTVYSLLVPPEMVLSINGKQLDAEVIWLQKGRKMKMTCFAFNSRPAALMSWIPARLNSEQITQMESLPELSISGRTHLLGTFNSTSTITYTPAKNAEVTCTAALGSSGFTSHTNIRIRIYGKEMYVCMYIGTYACTYLRMYVYICLFV